MESILENFSTERIIRIDRLIDALIDIEKNR